MLQAPVVMFVAFLVSLVISLLLTPVVIRAAHARGLFDNPRGGERGPNRPVPRLGGIVIFITAATAMLVALGLGAFRVDPPHQRFVVALFAGGTIVFGLGLYDDMRGTRVRTKLLAQCVAAFVVYALGTRVDVLTLGGAVGVNTGMLSLPLTIFWIVGVTNAFNLIDGLDGLASGIALVVLAAVMAAATVLGNADVVLVSLILVGALAGFLRYNLNPAQIFLGDSGSLYIGFMLAVLSMHGSLKSTTAVLVAIPIFALAVPLLDATLAVARRWLRGSPIFGPDARHIHHRMLAVGLTPRRASGVLCVVAAGFAVYGLSIAFAPPPMLLGVGIGGGALTLVLVLFGMRRLGYVEFAEAALAVSGGFGRVRKVIRDQIHARETVPLISSATTLDQLNAILADRARTFGFSRMEVNREEELNRSGRQHAARAGARPVWKMDYPVSREEPMHNDPFTLRIWCDMTVSYRPHGAERVARILAPCIEQWVAGRNGSQLPRSAEFGRRRFQDIAYSYPMDVGRPTEVSTSAQ